jgi:hypothetical protein
MALRRALDDIEATFGTVSVTSTCSSQNDAPLDVQAFPAKHPVVGGLKHFGGRLFHIDTASGGVSESYSAALAAAVAVVPITRALSRSMAR